MPFVYACVSKGEFDMTSGVTWLIIPQLVSLSGSSLQCHSAGLLSSYFSTEYPVTSYKCLV